MDTNRNMDSSIDSYMDSSEDSSVESSLDMVDVGNDNIWTDYSSTDDGNSTDSSNVDDINMDVRRLAEMPLFMDDSDMDSYEDEDLVLAMQFMDAVKRNESPETISALVKDKPQLLLEQQQLLDEEEVCDFLLAYPIYHKYGRIEALFAAFLRDNPELPSLRSSDGNTAMHVVAMFCLWDISIDVLKIISTPGAAQIQNEDGQTPLHLACIFDEDACAECAECSPHAIQYFFSLFPGAVRLADNEGMLPLHHICGNHLMKDVFTFELLIRYYPESLSVLDKSGNLPLHCACKGVSLSRIIAMLLELHPQSLYATGKGGSTVLHCVCGREWVSVDEERDKIDAKLLDLFPEALDMLDDEGRTPLMVLCIKFGLLEGDSVSGATLKRMIDMCPNAVRRSVEGGFTALHYLCRNVSGFLHSYSIEEIPIHPVLEAWPMALAIYGQDKRRGSYYSSEKPSCLPYGEFFERNNSLLKPPIADHLECETEAVFVACAESVLHGGFRYKNVKEHFRGMIARFYNDIELTSTSSSFVIARAIQERRCCSHTIWQAAFDNSDFQSLAKEDVGFQNLVCGLYKMNKKACGRDYDGNVPVIRQVMLLEEVIDNLDCVYVHLRQCPSLFFKDRGPFRKHR